MSRDDLTEDFLALYNQEQRRIHAYIRTLLFRRDDAEDVFQETCIALWRSFEQYEPGTNFGAWAREVARHRVLAHCKRRQGDKHVFSEQILATIADELQDNSELIERRQQALATCLDRLSSSDRTLLDRRYSTSTTTVQIAEQTGRSLSTLYKSLARIRRSLLRCVQMSLSQEEKAL